MPNSFGPTGLTVNTQAENLAQLVAALETIYGADIDTSPDSPDGQWAGIIVQLCLDLSDLLVQINNSFDPDLAVGEILDQRVAINGIQRQGGTFTVTPVLIKTSQSVNLYGLDQDVQPVYTVSDLAGNHYQLLTTQTGFNPGSGGSSVNFQAANPGAITPTPNTITVQVSIVLGVSSVNNPTSATTIGQTEESDAALRVRRQNSVSLSSQGYLAGLTAALQNITGVAFAKVYENDTDSTNANGIPSHSIWVIVNYSSPATPAQIANAIYTKRNAGCGMFGAQSFIITQINGTFFTVKWDNVVTENLFIKFNVVSIDGVTVPNIAAIRAGIITSLIPGVDQTVNVNQVSTIAQQYDVNSLLTSIGLDTAYNNPFTNNILSPTNLNYQFVLKSADVIIYPMILAAANQSAPYGVSVSGANIISTATVVHGGNPLDFSTLGGYGTDGSTGNTPPPNYLVYSIQSSTGGGASINATTGIYSSGAAGTDVILVTDLLSNTAICTVTVT